MENQIITVEDSGSVFLSPETLNLIGIKAGDKIEISVADHSLVVRSLEEAEREREIRASAKKIFARHRSVFERLAEGAS